MEPRRFGLTGVRAEDGATTLLDRGAFSEIPPDGDINISEKRLEREILPDAQDRFERLLNNHALEPIRDVETHDGQTVTYPNVDEWVEWRIRNGLPANIFPSFVRTNSGEVLFVKMAISKNNRYDQQIAREKQILASPLPTGDVVELVEVSSTQSLTEPSDISFLCTRAISITEGNIATAAEWTSQQAYSAAARIQEIEQFNLDDIAPVLIEIPNFERKEIQAGLMHRIKAVQDYLPSGFAQRLVDFIGRETLPTVFTHCDAGPKNIIISSPENIEFVDWEHAGEGLLGQDAGKLYNHLRRNEAAAVALLDGYVRVSDDNLNKQRLFGLCVGSIMDYFDHVYWRIENALKVATLTPQDRILAERDVLEFCGLIDKTIALAD